MRIKIDKALNNWNVLGGNFGGYRGCLGRRTKLTEELMSAPPFVSDVWVGLLSTVEFHLLLKHMEVTYRRKLLKGYCGELEKSCGSHKEGRNMPLNLKIMQIGVVRVV